MIRGVYNLNKIRFEPDSIANREFGIGDFGRKISARHLSFRNELELNAFLLEKTPFYISYSCARYEFPAARPMEKKNLVGADLIYEFDADDIQTECKQKHDRWKCKSCGNSGAGRKLACEQCGSGTLVDEWICKECLGVAKKQSLKLISFLEDDFGFSEGISVNFSGSKGYHVHVRNKSIQNLSKSARKELLDYVSATGLNLANLGFGWIPNGKKGQVYVCPKKNETAGWPKRVLEALRESFDSNDTEKIVRLGNVTRNVAVQLLKEKEKIVSQMDNNGLLVFPKTIKQDANKFWKSYLANVIDNSKIMVKSDVIRDDLLNVDRQTSVDIHKIVRVPDTVHGSTGLLAKSFPKENFRAFDPLTEPVVMPENEVKLSNAVAPEFHLKGEKFGPYAGESISIPAYAAFYLLARGAATEAG